MSSIVLPKLAHADDFEELIRDLFAFKFKNPNLQRYGRSGQKQQGIDIVAIAGRNFSVGNGSTIQCKNHTKDISDKDLCNEIEAEVKEFDESPFSKDDYYFVTSANNSKNVLNFVLELNKQRAQEQKSPITINFWDDICRDILENDFIFHKYFSDQFQIEAPENISIVDENINSRNTLNLKLSDLLNEDNLCELKARLENTCKENLGSQYKVTDPYNLYLGISVHPDTNFNGRVDLDISASDQFAGVENLEAKYVEIIEGLLNLVQLIGDPFFSKKIILFSDLEVNFAFLLGKALRKHRIQVIAQFRSMFMGTDSRNIRPHYSHVIENQIFPTTGTGSHDDLVFIFNMALTTNITPDVIRYLENTPNNYHIRSYSGGNGNRILNSAHAIAIAKDISTKINSLSSLNIKRIHMFMACPKPLALLIGHSLNTFNSELHLYFFSPDRETYLKTGVLTNDSFRRN